MGDAFSPSLALAHYREMVARRAANPRYQVMSDGTLGRIPSRFFAIDSGPDYGAGPRWHPPEEHGS